MATIQKQINKKQDYRSKLMDTASPIEFIEHSLQSAAAIANLQAYFCELVLKYKENNRLDLLLHDLREVQRDLNWLYSLKNENMAIKNILHKYAVENNELKNEVKKLTAVLNAEL